MVVIIFLIFCQDYLFSKLFKCGTPAHSARHQSCFAFKYFNHPILNPFFKFRVGFGMKGPAGFPQVFNDVDNINDGRKIHPFTICRNNQNRSCGCSIIRVVLPCFIKCVKVQGCSLCQLFYLAFGNMGTCGFFRWSPRFRQKSWTAFKLVTLALGPNMGQNPQVYAKQDCENKGQRIDPLELFNQGSRFEKIVLLGRCSGCSVV